MCMSSRFRRGSEQIKCQRSATGSTTRLSHGKRETLESSPGRAKTFSSPVTSQTTDISKYIY